MKNTKQHDHLGDGVFACVSDKRESTPSVPTKREGGGIRVCFMEKRLDAHNEAEKRNKKKRKKKIYNDYEENFNSTTYRSRTTISYIYIYIYIYI